MTKYIAIHQYLANEPIIHTYVHTCGLHSDCRYQADVTDNGMDDFDDSLLARFGLSDEYKSIDKPTQKNYLALTTIAVEDRLKKQEVESPW